MKNVTWICMVVCTLSLFTGCRTGFVHPMKKVERLQLGMSPAEVRDEIGRPYSIRSAKLFENEETTMIWEYWPPFLSGNQSKIHVYFENGVMVQWGQPGDFNTARSGGLREYKAQKGGR